MEHEEEVYEPSITSQLLDLLASRYAVKRSEINELFLEDVNDDERRRIRFRIRYVIEVLGKKGLIHVVPRRLVVNVPLLLFYYKVSGGSVEKSATALTSGPLWLKYSEAIDIVSEIVSKYSNKFDDFVSQLLYFRKLHDKLMNNIFRKIVKEVPKKIVVQEGKTQVAEFDDIDRNIEAVERFTQLLENTFYHYLLYIIVNDEEKQKEFLNEVRRIFKSFSEHLVKELEDRWRYIQYSINNHLAYDADPRIRSIARSFLERVVYVCLAL